MTQRVLRFYGLLFAVSGLVFVAGAPLVAWSLDLGLGVIPGARPILGAAPTLWLALTGAMMAMVAYLSLEAARDPGQAAAWNALLLSKATSTTLCAVFAVCERNPLFLVGSVVDGAIFLHLRRLRQGCAPSPRSLFAPRQPPGGYEVWFAKLNDPKTRHALWVRYTVVGAEASVWYVLFDAEAKRVLSGRWSKPAAQARPSDGEPFELSGSALKPGRLTGAGEAVSWELAWRRGASPPFPFVPSALALAGLASSEYVTPVSLGSFDGVFRIEGRDYVFREAPGCVGHIWGSRMAHEWRWAHAVFPGKEQAALEILSAEVRAGPVSLPRLTCAHLWFEGRHYESVGVWRGLRNGSTREGDRWSFRLDFGELAAEGECAPAPAMTAELDYDSPDGRRVVCRNSKTGMMRVRLTRRDGSTAGELSLEDAAAVEFAQEKA